MPLKKGKSTKKQSKNESLTSKAKKENKNQRKIELIEFCKGLKVFINKKVYRATLFNYHSQ